MYQKNAHQQIMIHPMLLFANIFGCFFYHLQGVTQDHTTYR